MPRRVARRVLREEGRRKAALLLDFYLLEAAGLQVWLVNARDVKNVPGRPKTDKLDSVLVVQIERAGHAAALVRATGGDP